jgi:hypothetical protein
MIKKQKQHLLLKLPNSGLSFFASPFLKSKLYVLEAVEYL